MVFIIGMGYYFKWEKCEVMIELSNILAYATILIADDTPSDLQVLTGLLKERGYATQAVTDGILALEAARINPPDLILLDINMPGMDGYGVCKALKADEELKGIPVIFISDPAETIDKIKAFSAGGVDYITKPFQIEKVDACVETHLKLRRFTVNLENLIKPQMKELSDSQMAIVMAMAKLAQSRDDDTGTHIERVQNYCMLLATKLGEQPKYRASIDSEIIDLIYASSALHDIGKVGIPDEILLKADRLSPGEFEIMKKHTVIGVETLERVRKSYPNNIFLSSGIAIARSHHEKWDGSGYPDGISGSDIPLSARIMAVADVYDGLKSKRSYKEPRSHKECCEIIFKGSGTQFDPDIVEAFRSINTDFESTWLKLAGKGASAKKPTGKWKWILISAVAVVGALAIYALSSGILEPHKTSPGIQDPNLDAKTVSWIRHGVVLDLGDSGAYDEKSIESPCVIKQADGSYVIWYRGQTWADKIGRIMRATSPDGVNWSKTGVVMTPSEEYEGDKIDPMTVLFEDGTYKMWYGGEGFGGSACYATSPDGINWTRYPGNPVLKKTPGGWDNEGAGGQHTVIRAGDKYYMYYKGFGSSAPGWNFYGLAESKDGIRWTKRGKILTPEPKIGETTQLRNLGSFRVDDYYCIIYSMSEYLQLFMATSKDGKSWKKNGLIFLRGQTPGDYDIKWTTAPCVLAEGDLIRMWYEGGDPEGRVRTLLAEVDKNQFLKAVQNTVALPAANK
jgi:putative two-component system response regulator